MATSVFLSEFSIEPYEKIRVIELTEEPSPTCTGFLPPSCPCGAVAIAFVWAKRSEKFAREYLNPVVFTFAMLFDSTSIATWCDWSPETPENNDFNIFSSL